MARTLSEGALNGINSLSGALQRRTLAKKNQFDEGVKLADLQSKGFNIQETSTPRKLFGFIPAGNQRSLSMSYDPTMNQDYQKRQLDMQVRQAQLDKAQREADPNHMTAYQRFKVGSKDTLTPGQRAAKDKATSEIYATRESNNVKRETLGKALEGAENVPQGVTGKMRMGAAKAFPGLKPLVGVNDKMIEDAQELKMALTDGTLAQTAHTKGAISDAEMMLFKEASANDDFNSPAIRPVLAKLKSFLDADEAGKYGAYKQNYGEDPRSWFNNETPSFASEEEADASGYKGPALIAGKKAILE